METSNGPSSTRNMVSNGRTCVLPPKIPSPCIPSSFSGYAPGSAVGPKGRQQQKDANSSENSLMEEKPSWLDDLLDEPETPLRKGCHRRASSDSFAYTDWKTSLESQNDRSFLLGFKNKEIDAPLAAIPSPMYQHPGFWGASQHADKNKDLVEFGYGDAKAPENSKSLETETRRTKQQYAQRSRVRRIQYIAELERTVQALQIEGSGASAEIEFINQKNIILSLENKALKQRLEGLAQEQHIKYMEHDMLEREVGRLKNLYQQKQWSSSSHRRTSSGDVETQFAGLTLKPKEASAAGE